MKSSTVLRTLCLVFAFAVASIAVLPAGNAVAQSKDAAKDAPKVSPKVGKALQAAMDAVKNKQFDVAEAKIAEAKAIEKRKPVDDFNLYEIEAYVLGSQQKYLESAALYEKMLLMPEFLKPDQHDTIVKKIAVYYFQGKELTKSIAYGERWLQDHPEDLDIFDLVGQGYYQTKDYKKSREYIGKAVAISEQAGTPPKEIWLRYLQANSVELDDEAAVTGAYEKMARYYPKPEVWDRLLGRLSINERSDRVMLQWLRLMGDAGVLKRADQLAEYTQLALDAALPGEATRIAESGYEKKLLGLDGKEKQTHDSLRARAKAGAQTDKAQLPQLEKEAQSPKATAGSIAGLGLAYFSFEQYDKAAQNLDAGLKKGGLKNTDDYVLALGISQWRQGQKEQARETFKSVAAESPLAKVASTWIIRTYN